MTLEYNAKAQVTMSHKDKTLTPELIINGYERAYRKVYGRDPRIRHIGGQWYYINGETVHRMTLMSEIVRLNDLAKQQSPYAKPTRSMVQRLIARLRGI
ncbi:MAG: hypothetical protein CL610_23715 [Anaerolineaceae bacterium]|nr:hypothetical protein [Anaerolineaceae bacterium]